MARPAGAEQPAHIDRRPVDFAAATRDIGYFFLHLSRTQHLAIVVPSDRVYPREEELLFAELFQTFPSSHPCRLRDIRRLVSRHTARNQERNRSEATSFVGNTVGLRCHRGFF